VPAFVIAVRLLELLECQGTFGIQCCASNDHLVVRFVVVRISSTTSVRSNILIVFGEPCPCVRERRSIRTDSSDVNSILESPVIVVIVSRSQPLAILIGPDIDG
jgi:hypothetical protein